jgi:hypothetical protein
MPELREHDAMTCRACGREERASEGYPCADCGTFICLICTMRGVVFCRTCAPKHPDLAHPTAAADAAGGGSRSAGRGSAGGNGGGPTRGA